MYPSGLLVPRPPCLLLPPSRRAQRFPYTLDPTQIQPRAKINHHEIEHDKSRENAVIEPFLAIKNVEAGCEFVPVGILAELAEAVGAVLDVAAGLGDEG